MGIVSLSLGVSSNLWAAYLVLLVLESGNNSSIYSSNVHTQNAHSIVVLDAVQGVRSGEAWGRLHSDERFTNDCHLKTWRRLVSLSLDIFAFTSHILNHTAITYYVCVICKCNQFYASIQRILLRHLFYSKFWRLRAWPSSTKRLCIRSPSPSSNIVAQINISLCYTRALYGESFHTSQKPEFTDCVITSVA